MLAAAMTLAFAWGRSSSEEDREAAATAASSSSSIGLPSHWPVQLDLLHWCHAAAPAVAVLLILAGIVYLLFGYSIFRILITVDAALVGCFLGATIGERGGAEVPAAVVGGLLAATAAWPAMKYSVAVVGSLFGATLGCTVWRLFDLDPAFAWSGGLTGLVFFGLLSMILFRGCIMTFTSGQGAVMVVLGVLSLVFKYDEIAPSLANHLEVRPFVLPLTIFVPTLLGFVYQQTMFPKPKPAGVGGTPPAGGPPKK